MTSSFRLQRRVSSFLLQTKLVEIEHDCKPRQSTMPALPQQRRNHNHKRCWWCFNTALLFIFIFHSAFQVDRRFGGLQIQLRVNKAQTEASIAGTECTRAVTFDDLEWIQLKGKGTMSLGFVVRIKEPRECNSRYGERCDDNVCDPLCCSHRNETFIARINYRDRHLAKNQLQIQLFEILNRPPTISNIPRLVLGIHKMRNPFRNEKYLQDVLQVGPEAETLTKTSHISVLVVELLENNRRPKNPKELLSYTKSLLLALEFAHSRQVINGDINVHNVCYDQATKTAKLFDWNEGWIYKEGATPMYYEGINSKMPPEGWVNSTHTNETAIHATVSSFDIWSTGLLLERLLGKMSKYKEDDKDYFSLVSLKDAMFTKDPYTRPNATQLLQHAAFTAL